MIKLEDISRGCLMVDGKGSVVGTVIDRDMIWREITYVVNGKTITSTYKWLMNHFYFVKSRKNDKV